MVSNFERRAIAAPEFRADGGTVRVEGYAAVFGEETNVGGMFVEVIERGAFAAAIGRDDVVFLINHEGLPLARTRAGTLDLSEDSKGLLMRADLDATDPDVARIVPKMRRGDLDKMSFAFWPDRQEWDDSGDMPKRIIRQASLHDVSIVTTPQYDGTEISLRALTEHRRAAQEDLQAWRLRQKRRLLR
jgi:HK97 family phage prohead protease